MQIRKTKIIDEIIIGEEASFTKTITEGDISMFAAMTGDFNPLHMDEDYAKNTRFGTRIAHGGVAQGLVNTVLGDLLGPGVNGVEFKNKYLAPVYPGDTITCTGIIVENDMDLNMVTIKFTLLNKAKNLAVIECMAKAKPPTK